MKLLRQSARAALSQSRRRLSKPSVHLTQQQHHRSLATYSNTHSLNAQANKYVSGVTPQQVEENQALADWYKANFSEWQDEPDQTIAGVESEEEKAAKEAAEKEKEESSAIVLPDELVNRNIRPLAVYLRERGREEGSVRCEAMRHPGVNDPNFPLIPGILHGSDPTNGIVSVDPSSKILVKTPWFEIQRELDRYHYGINGSFENRVYALTVFPSDEAHLDHHRAPHKDNTTYHLDSDTMEVIATPGPPPPTPPPRTPVEGMEHILVIPSDLQMHPVAHHPFCLNFIRYHPGKPIKIPIRQVNQEESPALKKGGYLLPINRFLECTVEDGAPIPEFIPLECTGLRAKDVVRRERLVIPEGVTVHPRVPEDYLMGTVFGVRGGMAVETEEEEEKK